MKRLAFKLVVFLLLGAVVNVGVAWGCAAWLQVESADMNDYHYPAFSAEHSPRWLVFWLDRAGAARYMLYPDDGESDDRGMILELPSWVNDAHEPPVPPQLPWAPGQKNHWFFENRVVQDGRGWPLLTLACELEVGPPSGIPLSNVDRARIQFSDRRSISIYSDSLRPILPGFLINTLFYAVILWLLWSAPFATRRLIRKRGGKCVRCGYDLRHAEHDVCPECGH